MTDSEANVKPELKLLFSSPKKRKRDEDKSRAKQNRKKFDMWVMIQAYELLSELIKSKPDGIKAVEMIMHELTYFKKEKIENWNRINKMIDIGDFEMAEPDAKCIARFIVEHGVPFISGF
jgi:hypothetical protein